ncbi:hypothetical protein Taro_005061 [Colocasia esculenta]|uniref:Uncharacterized protein n=1 Tax=Colocasia esculenta TaxID=4460 RepID=A0A843TTC4_COLES|nr:hypothetical protein [Colocasia esculenta]
MRVPFGRRLRPWLKVGAKLDLLPDNQTYYWPLTLPLATKMFKKFRKTHRSAQQTTLEESSHVQRVASHSHMFKKFRKTHQSAQQTTLEESSHVQRVASHSHDDHLRMHVIICHQFVIRVNGGICVRCGIEKIVRCKRKVVISRIRSNDTERCVELSNMVI